MFNIGDFVIGNASNRYWVTNDHTLCLVGRICNDSSEEDMYVFALEGTECYNTQGVDLSNFNFESQYSSANYYRVESERFHSITLEEWEEFKRNNNDCRYYKNVNYNAIINHFNKGGNAMAATEIITNMPVINLEGEYVFSDSQKKYAIENLGKIMTKYHHPNSKEGLETIWEEFKRNKAGLAYLLSMHPNWDADAMAVVLQNDYHRVKNDRGVKKFCDWCMEQIGNWAREREYKIACCTYEELQESHNRLGRTIENMEELRKGGAWGSENHHVTYDGHTIEELREDYDRIHALFYTARREVMYAGIGNVYLDEKTYKKYDCFSDFVNLVRYYESNIVDENFAEKANLYAEPFSYINANGKKVGLRATVGQKVSKVVNKFMKYYELDKIMDVKTETYTNNDGELCERQRDYGWNKQFADFADSINPLDVKRWTIISINPVDYITMSFGNGWSSCHTPDKENEREADGNYEGCYCSGTLSYMMDNCTLIMYTVKETYKGKDFCLQDKVGRCNIHVGEDKFIQGRLYPDGREADKETSLAGQFRAIMQTILSECVHEANLWKVLKGTGYCRRIASSVRGATNYPDWTHYDDCNVSFLKRNGIDLNNSVIKIGHKPICPNCGEEHSSEEFLACNSCRHENMETCAHCGAYIDVEHGDYIYDEDTGRYYCDGWCAERHDCYWCENVDEYHSEWVYRDDYTDNYFYDYHERDGIHINDDYNYENEENANNDGWIELDGDWYRNDDENVIECPHCGALTLADRDECLECGEPIDEDEIDEAV